MAGARNFNRNRRRSPPSINNNLRPSPPRINNNHPHPGVASVDDSAIMLYRWSQSVKDSEDAKSEKFRSIDRLREATVRESEAVQEKKRSRSRIKTANRKINAAARDLSDVVKQLRNFHYLTVSCEEEIDIVHAMQESGEFDGGVAFASFLSARERYNLQDAAANHHVQVLLED